MSNVTDVEFNDIEPKIYLTIPQIAEKIEVDEKRTRYWGETYGEEVGVEIVDGRRKYPEDSVSAFKEIKKLIDEHNYSKVQVISYFKQKKSKRGDKYSDISNATELIDPKDPLGIDILTTTLSVKIEEKMDDVLKDFLNKLAFYHAEHEADLIAKVKTELASEILDELRENSNTINSNIDSLKNNIKDIDSEKLLNRIDEKEKNETDRLNKIEENLRKTLENTQKTVENQEKTQKKWSFSQIFKKRDK